MKTNENRSLACTTCAKAKSRCIPGPPGCGKCERCHRLSKTCLSRVPAPPRAKRAAKRSRVAELEKRLSELEERKTQELNAGESPAGQGNPAATPASPILQHLFPSGDGQSGEESSAWPSKEKVASQREQQLKQLQSDCARESLWPMAGESEALLARYREKLAHLFPFVVVPHLKAAEMKEERPFLWKSIMMAGCFLDGARHEQLGEELMAEVSRAAMVEGVSSLDLLQGTELLVVWFHHALKSSRLTNSLFLARSLCLGLAITVDDITLDNAGGRDLDSLRAYAGAYYLNTLIFTTNKRAEVLMGTSLLDRCCSVIEVAGQHESDRFLVKLVRVQQLAQSISLTLAMEPGQQPMQLPMTIVVQSFQDQIHALRQSLSPELASIPMLESHISIAEVLLTEWALSDARCNASGMALTDRLRLLWLCVGSLKSIFSLRMKTWQDFENPRFTCMHGSDVSYALLTGVRIVTLRLPGWNLEHIERELAFGDVMDSLISHMTSLVARRRDGLFSTALRSRDRGRDGEGEGGGGGGGGHEDAFEGLMKLCCARRDHIRAEMARALADCKAEAGLDATTHAPPSGVMGELGSDYWRDVSLDALWNGTADAREFILQ